MTLLSPEEKERIQKNLDQWVQGVPNWTVQIRMQRLWESYQELESRNYDLSRGLISSIEAARFVHSIATSQEKDIAQQYLETLQAVFERSGDKTVKQEYEEFMRRNESHE